jgi:hypothetical protein
LTKSDASTSVQKPDSAVHGLAVVVRQAIGIGLDPQFFTPRPEAFQHVLELVRRPRALGIGPDADVLQDRGVLGLAQVRRPGQQRQLAVRSQIQALEEAEPEGVVAGQVIHAFLLKH